MRPILWVTLLALSSQMSCSSADAPDDGDGNDGSDSDGGRTSGAGGGGSSDTDGEASGGAELTSCDPPPKKDGGPLLAFEQKLAEDETFCFYMDQFEVTIAEYSSFLANSPNNAPDSPCEWNEAFTDAICTPVLDPEGDPEKHPQSCVDWCDATAYCASVDKVLCKGNPEEPRRSKEDSWYATCSRNGSSRFPFIGSNADEICATGTVVGSTNAVGERSGCVNETGHFDLVGNLAEWSTACDESDSEIGSCLVRGGDWTGVSPSCGSAQSRQRDSLNSAIGFRCCVY